METKLTRSSRSLSDGNNSSDCFKVDITLSYLFNLIIRNRMIFSHRVIKYDLHFQIEMELTKETERSCSQIKLTNGKDYILYISSPKMHQHHVDLRSTP